MNTPSSFFIIITAILSGCAATDVGVNNTSKTHQLSTQPVLQKEKPKRCQVSSVIFTDKNQCRISPGTHADGKNRDGCLKELDKTIKNVNELLNESDSCHEESSGILDQKIGSK